MKLSVVTFAALVLCAVSYAAAEYGPIITALQPQRQQLMVVQPEQHNRHKRSLLLGGAALLGAGAIGAGVLGAGVLGAGALGAGALGAGLIGAKAGFIGGAIASRSLGYGRSYGGYGGYGYGGYAHPVYYESAPVVYGGYPSYYDDEWC